MSGQSNQKVRKNASPSTKIGPIRATFPFGLRQGGSPTPRGGGRKGGSPGASPTPLGQRLTGAQGSEPLRKNPRSPDHRASPDNKASPSSPFVKDKSRGSSRHSPVPQIKRTSSLDTYLKGEWPRDAVVPFHTLAVPTEGALPLTAEKASQTPEEFWEEAFERKKRGSHIRSTSLGSGDALKKETIKARLAKSKDSSRAPLSGLQRNSPVPGNHAAITTATVSTITVATAAKHLSKAVSIPHIPKPTIQVRGSVEGLSQEIETLVLKSSGTGSLNEELIRTREPTPDGHRAPVAELLTTRSVDTQTPLGPSLVVYEEEDEDEEEDILEDQGGVRFSSGEGSSSNSSTRTTPSDGRSRSPSPASALPIIPGHMDTSRPSSSSEATKENQDCASPNLKSFSFVREPPDGCEKVKTVHEESFTGLKFEAAEAYKAPPSLFCPIKKSSEKYCIPSEVSAFCPLLKPYVLQSTLRSPPGGAIEGQ